MVCDPYCFPVDVDPSDIDFMGHANNAVYLKWVEAAVLDHWRKLAPPDAVREYAWVAVKHEITYRKPAFVHDHLMVIVRLEGVRRESAYYEMVIRRGDEILAEIQSRWCCLDAATLRPSRLAQEVIDKFVLADS